MSYLSCIGSKISINNVVFTTYQNYWPHSCQIQYKQKWFEILETFKLNKLSHWHQLGFFYDNCLTLLSAIMESISNPNCVVNKSTNGKIL